MTPGSEALRVAAAFEQAMVWRFHRGKSAQFANSAAVMSSKDYHYHLVRPGIAMYGGRAINGRPNPMAPVIEMKVPILQIKDARIGETVGYGAAYRLRRG